MTVRRNALTAAVMVGAVMAAGAGYAATDTSVKDRPAAQHCFFVTQWQGWSSPSPSVLLLGVAMHDVFRVDLSAPAPQLSWPGMHLISIQRGSSSICGAIDLDLKVADTNGFPTPLFPKTLTKLTPEEVAAIPRQFRPN